MYIGPLNARARPVSLKANACDIVMRSEALNTCASFGGLAAMFPVMEPPTALAFTIPNKVWFLMFWLADFFEIGCMR